MHLAELIGLRPVPCAGLLMTLTRRCPLHCAHCSSSSTMAGEEPDAADLVRFAGSFSVENRPEVIMLTGGEPLLRPGLVVDLAAAARRAGTRSVVLTGGFFAGADRIPERIRRAVAAVDHLSVSIDAFHEREVRREDVFRLLTRVLDSEVEASLHIVGSGPDDPYLADLTADTRRKFGDRVPMLVNTVKAVGRAADWARALPVAVDPGAAAPCSMAAWPVVAYDGTVLACCNQVAVDRRPAPEHLTLGHIGNSDWAAVRERALASPVLRMIRTIGPVHLMDRFGGAADVADRADSADSADKAVSGESGYCDTCRSLSDHPRVIEATRRAASGEVGRLLDQHAARVQYDAGPVAVVRRHGCARYADLVALTPRTGAAPGLDPS